MTLLTQEEYAKLGIRCPADILFMLPDRVVGPAVVTDLRTVAPGDKVIIDGTVVNHLFMSGHGAAILQTEPNGPLFPVLFQARQYGVVPAHVHQRLAPLGRKVTVSAVAVKVPNDDPNGLHIGLTNVVFIKPHDGAYPIPETRFYKKRGIPGSIIGATVQSAKQNWPVPDLIHVSALPCLPDAIKASMYADRSTFVKTPAGQCMALADLAATRILIERARAEQQTRPAPIIPPQSALRHLFIDEVCPYTLTPGQEQAAAGLTFDASDALTCVIEGDVGTGKTITAFLAVLDCVAAGYHAVLGVPIGTLARQHFDEISQYCLAMGVPCFLITAATTKHDREQIIKAMRGAPSVLIGTHAALDLVHDNIGLLVIDEQHLFGVRQREQLLQACTPHPHLLMLSATAQPRTLGQMISKDVRRLVLKERPPGRAPTITQTIVTLSIEDVVNSADKYIKRTGHAVYWVLPAVDDNEAEMPHVTQRFEMMQAMLPHRRVAAVHGGLPERELTKIFTQFRAGNIDILVASTVVQVGISVDSANLMVVESANRFGVAQLHQLRGRVGRGQHQGECWLVTEKETERCEAVAQTLDGFELARYDAGQRGMGNQLGTDQHGAGDYKIFDMEVHGTDELLTACDTIVENMSTEDENALLEFFGFGEWARLRIRA